MSHGGRAVGAAILRAARAHLDEACRDRRTPEHLLSALRNAIHATRMRGPARTVTLARQLGRPVPHVQALLLLLQERGEAVHDERGWRAA